MNECVNVTLTSVEVYCPYCSRFQDVDFSAFPGEGEIRAAEDVHCPSCDQSFDVELEVIGL